ncbi:hypothetical protein [Fulvivirga ligni]|uniref:hypothetical protein n=1 Tax=Fulvivirga ligni TaxID=2904246 RepID=UPI001F30D333|nr:hypothetical protein [Fulvivirga ligni]UII20590.1 hypothetical protein LVD16_22370 [Fulvivirga ligni]
MMIRLLVICACLCIGFIAKADIAPRVLLKLSVETQDGEKAEGYVYSKILTKNIVNFTLQEAKVHAYLYFETEMNANDQRSILQNEMEIYQIGEVELCSYSVVYLQSPTKEAKAKINAFQAFLSENESGFVNWDAFTPRFKTYLKELKALNILVLSFCTC